MFIATLHNSQNMESAKVSSIRWMNKEKNIYATMEYCSVIKKEWNSVICIKMVGTGGHGIEWNQTERQIPHILPCLWELKL